MHIKRERYEEIVKRGKRAYEQGREDERTDTAQWRNELLDAAVDAHSLAVIYLTLQGHSIEWLSCTVPICVHRREFAGIETIHLCPPEGSGIMPCCGRTPFEVKSDRMTLDPALVTCLL